MDEKDQILMKGLVELTSDQEITIDLPQPRDE